MAEGKVIIIQGKECLIDSKDYPLISRHKWILQSEGYARTVLGNQYIYMHQLVCPASGSNVVDHINHNRLDNRSKNLRVLSNYENLIHSKRFNGEFVGISFHSIAKKWRARIKGVHIGLFNTKEQAKLALEEFKNGRS